MAHGSALAWISPSGDITEGMCKRFLFLSLDCLNEFYTIHYGGSQGLPVCKGFDTCSLFLHLIQLLFDSMTPIELAST